MNCLLKFHSATKEQYIDFFIGCFDPYKRGSANREEIDYTMECLFKDQFQDGIEDEQNSLSADQMRILCDTGVVNEATGELDIARLRRAFRDGSVDIEVYKKASCD